MKCSRYWENVETSMYLFTDDAGSELKYEHICGWGGGMMGMGETP